MESYPEFVLRTVDVPDDSKEPFCPFSIGHCNEAYTAKCMFCDESLQTYLSCHAEPKILKGNGDS